MQRKYGVHREGTMIRSRFVTRSRPTRRAVLKAAALGSAAAWPRLPGGKCRCERPVATDADLSGRDRWVKMIERQRGAVIRKRAEGTRLSPKSVRHLTQTSG